MELGACVQYANVSRQGKYTLLWIITAEYHNDTHAIVLGMSEEHDERAEYEQLIKELGDEKARRAYAAPYDRYRPAFLPRVLGGILIGAGNLLYGRGPSYQKFRAIEVVARVPYHSWAAACFTLLTLFYADEHHALRLSRVARFATFASDNETMHVVVVSALARAYARAGFVRHTLVPVVFGFFYFWLAYLLYLCSPRAALDLNYLFEDHAYRQYSLFLAREGEHLKTRPVESAYLACYGRHPRSQYEFFTEVRNDELVHRNRSVREASLHARRDTARSR